MTNQTCDRLTNCKILQNMHDYQHDSLIELTSQLKPRLDVIYLIQPQTNPV